MDEVNLQLLNRTFVNQNPVRDVFFENHFFHDSASKQNAITKLAALVNGHATDPLLRTKPKDLTWFERYIDAPDRPPEGLECAAHWRNAIVDSDGEVSLCFGQPDGISERSLGNVRDSSLTELLAGASARRLRSHMARCAQPCSALECHRDSEAR